MRWVAVLTVCATFMILAGSTHAKPNGLISVLTGDYIVHQPYPSGPRRSDLRTDPGKYYQCTGCDPGAPTELCFQEFDVCAKLSDSAVTIFRTDGVKHASMALNPNCHPRSFQRLAYHGLHISIECHNYTSQIVSLQRNDVGNIALTLHNYNNRVVQSEITVEGTEMNGEAEVYHVEIEDNALFQTNFHSGTFLDITPPNVFDCDFITLFNVYTQNKFLLWCDTNTDDGKRIYVIDVNHDFVEAPSVASNSPPLSSPDGQTFVTVDNTTLRAYKTNSLTTQPPGARNFGSRISYHTFIDDSTLLIVLKGQPQTLVNVTRFIDSSGTDGITPLSSATLNATLHKSILGDTYVTYNKSGNLYNLLVYTTDGQLMTMFPNFASEPDNLFFKLTLPPSPLPSPTTTTDHATVTMTTSPHVKTMLDSHLLPSVTPATEPTKEPNHTPLIIVTTVAVPLFLFTLAVVVFFLFVCLFVCIKNRRKPLLPIHSHPTEETQKSENTTHMHSSSNILLQPFSRPASPTASEGNLYSPSPLYPFTDPIQETSS